jgi:ATP-binding cassette, subfamily G (WHITE), member 2, PDR
MLFRTIASVSRTISQAMVPAGLIILGIVMFTGFVIPVNYMLGWSRWINYGKLAPKCDFFTHTNLGVVDPVAYGFESLMINEFHGRYYQCSSFVPTYGNLARGTQVCSAIGSVAGQSAVSGTAYIESAFHYDPSHRWRYDSDGGMLNLFLRYADRSTGTSASS